MKTKHLLVLAAAMAAMTACGASKNAAQTAPAQTVQSPRGVKIEKEECEVLAMEKTDNLRAAGNAQSAKESFATNLAVLDARTNLAQQLEVLVTGMITNFDEQHNSGKTSNLQGKADQRQQGYFDQFLSNTRQIAKNTYVQEDGTYNVYVCVELDPEQQRAMHKKLTDDQIIGIDYREHLFMEDMAKAKEEYRQKQLEQQ